MAKQGVVANIETKLHGDGAVSHHVKFTNGEEREIHLKAGHALAQQFIAHGSKAKIQAAINSGDSVEKSVEKVDALGSAFEAGRWTMNEGTGKPKGSTLVRALIALSGKSFEVAEAYVKGLSRAHQAKLRATPAVAAKILELEAEERTEAGQDVLSDFLGTSTTDAEEENPEEERTADALAPAAEAEEPVATSPRRNNRKTADAA